MFLPERSLIIVTGHSRGLGQGIAQAFLADGFEVLGMSRQRATWAPKDAKLAEIELDLADTSALLAYLNSASFTQRLSQVSGIVLINNAGVVGPIGPAGKVAGEQMANAIALNITAPLVLTNAIAKAGKPAKVVHISSGAARQAYAGWGVYCATKAALDHHARAHALDAVANVQLVSLAPGVIDTDMQGILRQTSESAFPNRERFVALKEQGQLVEIHTAGRALVDYVNSDSFASQVTVDLRNLV